MMPDDDGHATGGRAGIVVRTRRCKLIRTERVPFAGAAAYDQAVDVHLLDHILHLGAHCPLVDFLIAGKRRHQRRHKPVNRSADFLPQIVVLLSICLARRIAEDRVHARRQALPTRLRPDRRRSAHRGRRIPHSPECPGIACSSSRSGRPASSKWHLAWHDSASGAMAARFRYLLSSQLPKSRHSPSSPPWLSIKASTASGADSSACQFSVTRRTSRAGVAAQIRHGLLARLQGAVRARTCRRSHAWRRLNAHAPSIQPVIQRYQKVRRRRISVTSPPSISSDHSSTSASSSAASKLCNSAYARR